MRKAGIREARQNLSALIDEVAKGRRIEITDRGRPVAMLVPPIASAARGLPDLRAVRRRNQKLVPPLSGTVVDQRDDRF
jgi:prevent-host-death family protein